MASKMASENKYISVEVLDTLDISSKARKMDYFLSRNRDRTMKDSYFMGCTTVKEN